MLAERLKVRSGTTSWHLQKLAEHGFIEEVRERGNLRTEKARMPHRTPQTSRQDRRPNDLETLIRNFLAGRTEEFHSVLVVRPGAPTVEVHDDPQAAEDKHIMNSCTKSFLATLVGIAIDTGSIISAHTTVLEYFQDVCDGNVDQRRARITIEHLLTMSSGIYWPQSATDNASDRMVASPDWISFILEQPMAAEPGRVANYSNGDAHLLSALLERATGVSTLEFAREHLFTPLGIIDIRWDHDPAGVTIGSATLYLKPRDMAKLGLLYLAEGQWEGRRIISSDWIRTATQPHSQILSGRSIDYGYYWWIYPERAMYEAWGGQGQRIACFPLLQTVVVATADIDDDSPNSSHANDLYTQISSGLG
jgi:CubicO group peptidase (beta-lactamase class C family)